MKQHIHKESDPPSCGSEESNKNHNPPLYCNTLKHPQKNPKMEFQKATNPKIEAKTALKSRSNTHPVGHKRKLRCRTKQNSQKKKTQKAESHKPEEQEAGRWVGELKSSKETNEKVGFEEEDERGIGKEEEEETIRWCLVQADKEISLLLCKRREREKEGIVEFIKISF